jgi:PAS domain S-box-containing protein
MNVEDARQTIAQALAKIQALQCELAETNRGVVALALELGQRLEGSATELSSAHAELRKTNSELMQLTLELEDRVAQRTAELDTANGVLQQCHVSALKMIEEAVVARGQAEQASAALQREMEERKRAEESVRASEVQYRRLFETAQNGILILDTEMGMVVDVNPFLVELLGFSREVFLGKKVWELGFFKDIAAHQANFAELQQKGYVRYDNLPLETSAGRRIEVEFVSKVYQVDHTKVMQCNIRDITERRRSEDRVRCMQVELEQSNRDLQRRNEEIQAFYHTLSHELKTPLTSAREFIAILMDGLAGPLNETQLEYLGIAKESCDQLRLYINDMLDVTRLETGKMSLEFQVAPLAPLVENMVGMLAAAAAGKGIHLSRDCQPDLPAIPFDMHRIQQVLTNLVTNAIKFTPSGGKISLHLSEAPADPQCLQVTVRDTGCGIPKNDLGLIFNRLYQVPRDATVIGSRSGLGLGLYICQELVQLHGGRIWAESEPGQGSAFTFTIPKSQPSVALNVLVAD